MATAGQPSKGRPGRGEAPRAGGRSFGDTVSVKGCVSRVWRKRTEARRVKSHGRNTNGSAPKRTRREPAGGSNGKKEAQKETGHVSDYASDQEGEKGTENDAQGQPEEPDIARLCNVKARKQ